MVVHIGWSAGSMWILFRLLVRGWPATSQFASKYHRTTSKDMRGVQIDDVLHIALPSVGTGTKPKPRRLQQTAEITEWLSNRASHHRLTPCECRNVNDALLLASPRNLPQSRTVYSSGESRSFHHIKAGTWWLFSVFVGQTWFVCWPQTVEQTVCLHFREVYHTNNYFELF